MFISYLCDKKILHIKSTDYIPEWISSFDVQSLAVGMSNFTCCQRNHVDYKECDRELSTRILSKALKRKCVSLFANKDSDKVISRWYRCFRPRWMRNAKGQQQYDKEDDDVKSLKSFMECLKWKNTKEFFDEKRVSILLYASVYGKETIVREILDKTKENKEVLHARIRKQGYTEVAIPGACTALNLAMSCSSPNISIMLLESGANPYDTDINGLDPLMCASVVGQLECVKMWLERFKNWDLNRKDTLFGGNALISCASVGVYNKLEITKLIVRRGGDLERRGSAGSTVLMSACRSKDADLDQIKYILKSCPDMINKRYDPITTKWNLIFKSVLALRRIAGVKSGVMKFLTDLPGCTALHEATRRGDLRVVEILMGHGACPKIKNKIGESPLDSCEGFPEIKGAILRSQTHQNNMEMDAGFTLNRRSSTTSPVLYPMYLLSVNRLMQMYLVDETDEDDTTRSSNMMKRRRGTTGDILRGRYVHQHLLKDGMLTRFEDLPLNSFVIFVSHEWLSDNHPDPHGVHMRALCETLSQLRKGAYETSSTVFHRVVYKNNTVTSPKEWKALLSCAYVWFDWFSQPQPSADMDSRIRSSSSSNKDGRTTPTQEDLLQEEDESVSALSRELKLAIRTMPVYVERSDCLLILTPGSVHSSRVSERTRRKMNTCYRTWRSRAFCVLELFCSFLSKYKTHPNLLVDSATDRPHWLSVMDSIRLSVGQARFTCCDNNHVNLWGRPVSCDRIIARDVLTSMCMSKVEYLYKCNLFVMARLFFCLCEFWCRGLGESKHVVHQDFREMLRWQDDLDDDFYDRSLVSILVYAVLANNVKMTKQICERIDKIYPVKEDEMRIQLLESRIPSHGPVAKQVQHLGMRPGINTLHFAMFFSSTEIVKLLLSYGVNPKSLSIPDSLDAVICASISGNVECLKYFLKQYPNWDMNRQLKMTGAKALHCAVLLGANKLDVVKVLIENGASPDVLSNSGSSVLTNAVENVDSGPDLIEYILKRVSKNRGVHYRQAAKTTKFQVAMKLSVVLTRMGQFKHHARMSYVAHRSGRTALHCAMRNGDVEIIEILLSEGANLNVKDNLGMTPIDYAEKIPEIRGTVIKLARVSCMNQTRNVSKRRLSKLGLSSAVSRADTTMLHRQGNSTGGGSTKKTQIALGKRISTATPLLSSMWVISLDTLEDLYGSRGRRHVVECHQELKRRGLLTRWTDLPSDAEIIFVSHEWLSWAHPDPKGEQLYVLCRVMERLRAGEIDSVEMDMVMSMFYKWNFRTSAEEWKEMLERTYIWFDWLSMPQPSAEKANSKNIDRIRIEGSKAIRSIPAYVERCDFVMILAPTGYHSDRKVSTCYRTWRRRGWCLLELFASMMSRDQSNPALLVRSAESTPIYIAQMEVQKLSIGLADFTCCQRNHVIVTETQKILAKKDDDDDDDDKKKKEEDEINEESSSSSSSNKIACDKPIAGRILKSLIRTSRVYLLLSLFLSLITYYIQPTQNTIQQELKYMIFTTQRKTTQWDDCITVVSIGGQEEWKTMKKRKKSLKPLRILRIR